MNNHTPADTTHSLALHSEVIGRSGPNIVVLHGWGHSLLKLKPLAELFAGEYVLHLLDLPGFGGSPAPHGDWDTLNYAKCVLDYINEKKLGQVIIIGHSLGGRIALRLCALAPQVVAKQVLIASHGLRPQRSLGQRARFKLIALLRAIVKLSDRSFGSALFEKWFVPRFASADYLAAGDLRGTLVKIVAEDQSESVKKIKVPTLLLWGDQDQQAPLDIGQRLAKWIQGSHLVVFPGKGHEPFADAGAHLCAFHMREFLKS